MDAINPVLARKLGQPVAEDAHGEVISPTRIMRRAVARAADQAVGLSASVLGIEAETSSAEALVDDGPEGWVVLGLRSNNEAGLRGVFLIDPVFRSALVEMQTMGSLLPAPAEQRAVTGTDATLTVPFASRLLQELDETGFAAQGVQMGGLDIGAFADLRTAGLVLGQGNYHYWRVTLQIGGSDAQGEIMIAVRPDEVVVEEPVLVSDGWRRQFQNTVCAAPAELDAVLATFKMPMSKVEAFTVGQVVSLAGTTVGSVTLAGPDGVGVASARLGQVAGKRAVRIEAHSVELQDVASVLAATGAAPPAAEEAREEVIEHQAVSAG